MWVWTRSYKTVWLQAMQVAERCMLSANPPKILASSPWSVIKKVSLILPAARRWTTLAVVVQSLRRVWPSVTPWTAAHQASLSFTTSQSLLKLMSIKLVMHLVCCCPLLPSIFPSSRVFSNALAPHIRCPKFWSFSITTSNEYSGIISLRTDLFDLLAVQGTLKSLLQHYSSKASILRTQPSLWSNTNIQTWLLKKS